MPPTLGESLPTLINLEKPSQACSEVLLLGDSSLRQVHSSNHHTSPVALQALQTDIPNSGPDACWDPGNAIGKIALRDPDKLYPPRLETQPGPQSCPHLLDLHSDILYSDHTSVLQQELVLFLVSPGSPTGMTLPLTMGWGDTSGASCLCCPEWASLSVPET